MTAIRSYTTVYRGTRFRSRLEAHWAAFYDLIRWSWVYEPFDTDGWIPDFLIQGDAPFLVEVGPCLAADDYIAKATKPLAFPDYVTLVLGISPRVNDPRPRAGYLTDDSWEFGPGWARWARCAVCQQIGVFHTVGSFQLRPCGHADGDNHLIFLEPGLLEQLWRRAGNDVQWAMRRPQKVGDILAGLR